MLLAFNKPYGVLCQFRPSPGRETLKNHIAETGVYPAGRLDADSEGLVLLTDDGGLQHRITDPRHKLPKTYYVEVEGIPTAAALDRLRQGVELSDGPTLPASVAPVDPPEWLWPRNPPVRFRKHIPTTWLEFTLREGRNRQVRRMTAAVGFPTLRLIRYRIGDWSVGELAPGERRIIDPTASPGARAHIRHRPRGTFKR